MRFSWYSLFVIILVACILEKRKDIRHSFQKENSKQKKKVFCKNFQYSKQAVEWINNNNIKDVISMCDAGRGSEGVRLILKIFEVKNVII